MCLCKIPCSIPMCSAGCATSTAPVVFYEGPPDVLCFIFLPPHHSSVSLPPIYPFYCLIPSSSLHLNRSSLWINSKEPIFRRQHLVFRIKTYLHTGGGSGGVVIRSGAPLAPKSIQPDRCKEFLSADGEKGSERVCLYVCAHVWFVCIAYMPRCILTFQHLRVLSTPHIMIR